MTIQTITQKSRSLIVAGLIAGVVGAAAVPILPKNVSAATNCDKVNIVYCGTNGGNTESAISAFKTTYASNKSGHAASPTVNKDYTDLQAVYAWAGASSATVQGMNATNTKIGTLYRDGRIVVDGKTVGTGAWVTARFTNGAGFVKVTDGVYARKTTTSFENASAQVLVHMKDGQMTFAVMTICGNAVKATPVPVKETPKPTPETPVTTTPKTPKAPEVTTVAATPAPEELPQTGPASVIGLVSGVSLAGASAHRIATKLRRQR